MRAVVQRVTQARVSVDVETVGAIGSGLCVLLGVGQRDDAEHARWLAEKVCGLRIFADGAGKMNLSLRDVQGGLLAISQFTLWADTSKGRRPSFGEAMEPIAARALFERFVAECLQLGVQVEQGRFGAHMRVELVNDGPVTLLLDSERR